MWAQIINMVLGLGVMAAPAVWWFPEDASNNNYIAGPLVITFAMIAITDVGRSMRWFNVPLACWLTISPFILDYDGPALPVNVLLGVVIGVLSLVKGKVSQRFGGGWRSLFQKEPAHVKAAEEPANV